MSDKPTKQIPADPQRVEIRLSPPAMALMNSSIGDLMRRMIAVSASLQSWAASFGKGMVTEKDMEAIFMIGVHMSKQNHVSEKEVLDDMILVGRTLVQIQNEATEAFIQQSTEDTLNTLDLVMPENRMMLDTIRRSVCVMIIGAPEDAVKQLEDNIPDGTDLRMTDVPPAKGVLKATAESLEGVDSDLHVITGVDKLIDVDVNDPGAPLRSRAGEVCRRITRLVEGRRLSLLLLADEMDNLAKDAFAENGVRVIKWNDEFGPEVFYGKEEATARRQALISDIEVKRVEAQAAVTQAQAEDAEDSDPGPEPEEPPTKGRIIV